MSAARFTRRAPCGHRRCTAARHAMTGAGACTLGSLAWLFAAPSAPAAGAFAVSVITLAAASGAACSGCWYHDDPGQSTLDDILASPRLPKRWTRAHWDELERQLSYCHDNTEED